MFLSDHDIRSAIENGEIGIDPFDPAMIQPASIDLTLDEKFKSFRATITDPREPVEMIEHKANQFGFFSINAGDFLLASTVERVTIGSGLVGRLEGKSSIGRLGLTTHVTAGFFDPGFSGYATLELFNASGRPILLYPGMKICQMSFARLQTPAHKPYGHSDLGSKYQNQSRGPKASEYHKNFDA